MHSWKKKLVLSQLALACTLAITSQANAATNDISGKTYNTFHHYNDVTYADDVYYDGYVGWNNYAADSYYNGDIYPVINNATVNGVISTYYLDDGISTNTNANSLTIKNSTIHGMIYSECMTTDCADRADDYYHDRLALTVDNSTIDDNYEHYTYNGTYNNAADTHVVNVFNIGTAITLDQEVDLSISNNSHVAGITLTQGYEWEDIDDNTVSTGVNSSEVFNNTITVKDSTVTSGSWSDEGTSGWFGKTGNASEYSGKSNFVTADTDGDGVADSTIASWDDVALAVVAHPNADNAMQTTAGFSNSTLMGDVIFSSNFDENFFPRGADSYRDTDGEVDTNGWDGTDRLDLTLNNGSKWVGAAQSVHQTGSIDVDGDGKGDIATYGVGTEATATLIDIAANSLWPSSTVGVENNDTTYSEFDHITGNQVYQSGLFNVTLNTGSQWDTTKTSLIDTLSINSGSTVNVADSTLVSDSISLTGRSALNIKEDGHVATDSLTIDNSTVTISDEVSAGWGVGDAALYANTINVTNDGILNVGNSAANALQAETLNLTSTIDTHGNIHSGVFNIESNRFVLDADLVNDRTNDTTKSNYGYGVIAMNSDGHLTINGNGDNDNTASIEAGQNEVDNAGDRVAAATGNYKVRIDNATGAGSVADYNGNELIYVNDKNSNATFSAANKADLGAYTYQAEQVGNTVVLQQMELTDYANMALSIPSANTNIWNLQQDTVGTRLTNARHGLADNGGAWVSYFGGNFNGDNGTINYDQDVNGIMVGVDTKIDGNNAKWIVGAAAGFAKGDVSDRSGQVDQDSQSAYIYSSARFANNIFVDGNLSYSHFNSDLTADMSNGQYVDGNTASDAWGFGLKAGYDFKLGDAGYVTPYGSVSGLFQSGDDYRLSNNMKVDGQSYDSMRYELGVDAGYTFAFSDDQAMTPYFKLAYVYDDSNNDADVNGDSIDNGTEGSAVRVGLGTQFSFTKNFSAYTDANYLGGGDVDQDWSANVGVKYTW
ncbi:autotransporter outer membrane beta-barrel domain-containing protein [Escherichia fergusonii]|uniref:autotransporter outer membrane beta-barrel domain-containing protein n=1 Tax=Escherichia fergusonii TaxID=564 RepID=UPI0017E86269|nr:autotransporter outer membrane beta-barrel domain-containing protein [Escherichia fergusonii]EFL4481774.1 autotransporter adhesin EhaB [Escherichia fergusonii]MBY7445093.1 autotransporter adhesin EhaB [Escherichia fergusonii]MBY7558378.1 autotransporter adhesin EhaB [Escherichia fergusonii]MCH5366289.1 autotransporter adhesin EhaB [Escherichia fergusonii]HCO5013822.1 autotransporter adhesin EhaB [Escherichia fergusonii]